MKRAFQSPWAMGGVVLVLAVLPALAALSSHRRQAAQAEALLFERSAEVVAGHLRLLTTRQLGWQNALRMRLSNRPEAPERTFEAIFAPGSGMNRPENCLALGYAAEENSRVVLHWQRGQGGDAFGSAGEDLLARPETGNLLRAGMETPARIASTQNGDLLLTAMAVADASPRKTRGWLLARWDLAAMCADPQIRIVASDRTLAARPLDSGLRPGEHEVEIGEGDARWRAAVGRGDGFAALFPRVSERALAIAGGTCAVLLALLAGLVTRSAGLRADLASERELRGMKDHLLHSVSHEFRTPLSVILSGTELLENYGDRLPPERRSDTLEQIRHATVRMNDMVGQVLLLSRIEAHRLPVNPKPLDAAAFARGLAREAETAAGGGRTVQVDAPDSLPANLDPVLLRTILGNLLENALKFSPAEAPVEFRVEPGDRLRFTVRDLGPGIAPGDLPRVREPFFRTASAEGTPGTGLGLTLADKCATLLGGELLIESGPGGTMATFIL